MDIKILSERLKRIENLLSLRNIRKYELRQEVKATFILALLSYIICFIFLLIINIEKDYSKLKYGPIVVVLYFGMLIIFVINLTLLNHKIKKERLILKTPSKIEIILRFFIFILVFINFKELGINITVKIKFQAVIASFIISLCIIAYMFNKVKNHKIDIDNYEYTFNFTQKDIVNYRNGEDYISFGGVLLYIYSSTSISISTLSMFFKFIAFNSVGFIVNIFGAFIIEVYFSSLTKANFYGIRDILGIFSIMCAVPLFKEYEKIATKMMELRDYISNGQLTSNKS